MSSLLSDMFNNRVKPVPPSGIVETICPSNHSEEEYDSETEEESDTEQIEFVRQEMKMYFSEQKNVCGLTDIVDIDTESVVESDIYRLVNVPAAFRNYNFTTFFKKELPIDSFRDKILALIKTNSVVVIHGATGCGKTTQVPQYILDDCKERNAPCNIIVTQPRRIAAINISQRVCSERGWALGTVCGYQVGLDKKVQDDVVLTYVTTEVLLQKLILQRNLNKYTHIIIDEVHERTKTLDFLLLLARKYLFTNSPNVKIILMSATIEANKFAFYFRTLSRLSEKEYLLPPILQITKKSEYTTNYYYLENIITNSRQIPKFEINEPAISREMYELCLSLILVFDSLDERDPTTEGNFLGSVLVFLPGYYEIEEMQKLLDARSRTKWEVIPLHSSLSNDHMSKAFLEPKPGIRKIILSTNIAESSLTVPDVIYVIDFCLTKIMTVNPLSKFATLGLYWASHDNCKQRAGRVGRVANGRVYRLVPQDFYKYEMENSTTPEIQRAPLENIILYVKMLDLNDTPKNILSLAISPPSIKDVENCILELKEAGGLLQTCRGKKSSVDGDVTFLGKVMASLPIDIRFAKLIILGHMFSCLNETIIMAAGATTRNLFTKTFNEKVQSYRKKLVLADGSSSDLIAILELHEVYMTQKRDHAFANISDEYSWCRTNYVNLKGLKEMNILIKDIYNRLKRFRIEVPVGPTRIPLLASELPLVLKVVICGAFYPNYFIRSSDYGQVNSREAVKLLGGRDPYNTVYFSNMRMNQPGQIYVRQIKEMFKNSTNIRIGFEASKVFVEFKNVKRPEVVMVDGNPVITTIPGSISMDVYESIRKRQLKMDFPLRILSDAKAREFAEKVSAKTNLMREISREEVHCFSTTDFSPLPTLDVEYMTIYITHIFDAGHFYCQNYNDESAQLLDKIYRTLNNPETNLEPAQGQISDDKFYVAKFSQDGLLYRCKTLGPVPGRPTQFYIIFVDYGNTQTVSRSDLYEIPQCEECFVHPIAVECVLSEVQPSVSFSPKALWDESVNALFRRKTKDKLLYAKVYSVVDEVVHLELFLQRPKGNVPNSSFNDWVIEQGYASRCEESYLSKLDHEQRLHVMGSENPNNLAQTLSSSMIKSYTDFESPDMEEDTSVVYLKGPFNPLEMSVTGLVQAALSSSVLVERDSVNAVLLDDTPDDPHARLLVAGLVAQSGFGTTIKISQTTIMPNIPGLPLLMLLMFSPCIEPKVNSDGTKVVSILCGLGAKENSNKSCFPMHDIAYILDTELKEDLIVKINELRYVMNKAIKVMNNIYDELAYANELYSIQKNLKENLFRLLRAKYQSVERESVKYHDIWNKSAYTDIEILKMTAGDEVDDIWPLLWFVKLNGTGDNTVMANLKEIESMAKGLIPEKEMICVLCKSDIMRNASDARIHLFREEHKKRYQMYKNEIH